MPIKCILKQQPLFLTPVKKCMNWHICKLISVFLQWPHLLCVLGCCILRLRKAESISRPHNLCVAVLWGRRKERGLLKQVLRQEGAVDFRFLVAWREREETVTLSPNVSGPYLLLICTDLPQKETPQEPRSSCSLPTLSLLSPSSDPKKPS